MTTKNIKHMKHKLLALILVLVCTMPTFGQEDDARKKEQDRYFDINKNVNIFNSVLRELDLFYVDTLNVEKSVRTGIDYMLNSLDPYTVYYNEEDMKDFNFMTTGEYAGVGATVGHKDGKIIFADPFEGKPAAKAGIKAGDIILAIDGKDMTTCEEKEGEPLARTLSTFVSNNLKGQPSTVLEITVERFGEKKPLKFKVTREKIVIDPISYYEMLDEKTGYIKLTGFTDKSAMDMKNSFAKLKEQGMGSLIIDLRENGGGIMEEAVEIVNMFVPKGKLVLSTKGKLKQTDRIHKTTVEPLDTDIPIVVLVDEGSASASEIVAGALQDMDRAVLVGARTFGKGLVQLTREVPFGGAVKVTTSKYYIPSGRCVQALDYSHRKADGSVTRVADSLTNVFHTEIGREVRDGGGVTPDITLEEVKVPTITYYLNNQYIIFDWVTEWIHNRKNIAEAKEFTISDEEYEKFKEFVKSKKFEYDRMSEKSMKQLKEIMEFEGYMKSSEEEFKALEAKLVPDLERDLNTFKTDIMQMINAEIVKRYYYQKGEFAANMKYDAGLKKALEVMNDTELYKKTLSAPSKEESVELELKQEKEQK